MVFNSKLLDRYSIRNVRISRYLVGWGILVVGKQYIPVVPITSLSTRPYEVITANISPSDCVPFNISCVCFPCSFRNANSGCLSNSEGSLEWQEFMPFWSYVRAARYSTFCGPSDKLNILSPYVSSVPLLAPAISNFSLDFNILHLSLIFKKSLSKGTFPDN